MARRENGFTIIETTLVLAITGLIIAVILVGIGNSLNHQRYTDAVNQATDFFRGQYASTSNVVNDRSRNEICTSSGVVASPNQETVGASDCLLLGKIIRSSDGENLEVYQVIATHDPTNDTGAAEMSDTGLLVVANLRQGNEVIATYRPEWGTQLLRPGTADPARFTIMVVRAPVTGTVRTYATASDTATVADLLATPPAAQTDLRVCVDQAGFFGIGVQPMGIVVSKDATNTTGVQIIPAGECV